MNIQISQIQKIIADHFGLTVEDLTGRSHSKAVAQPRMLAIFLCRKMTGHSSPAIGRHFNRDHSTVLKAEKDMAARIKSEYNPSDRWMMSDLIRQIRNVGAERVPPKPPPEPIPGLEQIQSQLASMAAQIDRIEKTIKAWEN